MQNGSSRPDKHTGILSGLLRLPRTYLFAGSLGGLVAGLGAGFLAHYYPDSSLGSVVVGAWTFGQIWSALITLVILPVIAVCLVHAVLSMSTVRLAVKLGAATFLVHGLLLLMLLTVTLGLGLWFAPRFASVLPTTGQGATNDPTAGDSANRPTGTDPFTAGALPGAGFWQSLSRFNQQAVFPILVIALVAGGALLRCGEEIRRRVLQGLSWTARITVRGLNLLLLLLPPAIFGLIAPLAWRTGLSLAPAILQLIVYTSGILLLGTLILYGVIFLFGRIAPGHFTRAMLPAQAMALTTRSSLACMPLVLETAINRLGLPRHLAELVLSISVTMFRPSNIIASPFQLLLIAHMMSIELTPAAIAGFVLGKILLSFGAPGVPDSVTFRAMPFWLAAGIPMEGYILHKAVGDIPDMFKTMVNITEDITVVTLVARKAERSNPVTRSIWREARDHVADTDDPARPGHPDRLPG
jgi:Na+/H+-dicarboxylate symporter